VPALKPAYLIHGDDHGRVAERRANLRALAEAQGGAAGYEVLEGDASTPAAVAAALSAMTLALGQRILIVDGAERFRPAEVSEHLAPVLAGMPPQTTVAFFAREEGRAKVPPALIDLVRSAGGEVREESMVKPWKLPGWVVGEAARLGLKLDTAAARALVAQVGERQQRLLRELERLAQELAEPGAGGGRGAPVVLDAEEIEARAAHSSERRVWALADAVAAGDRVGATSAFLELRAQGERLGGLVYWMAQRLRLAHEVASRLQDGEPEAQVRRTLRMPTKAAERFIADARRSDPERLRRAIEATADLELGSRGGSQLSGDAGRAMLSEDTQTVLAIAAITAE
jgi:DNA polymerase III subunit delta